MFKKLKHHWEVQTKELILILCTFAITGTLTAWLSKKVAEWLFLDKFGLAWWLTKIIVLIFGYQVIILVVGFCFGMFSFFWKYEKKILARLGFFKKEIAHKIIDTPLVSEHHGKQSFNQSKSLLPEPVNFMDKGTDQDQKLTNKPTSTGKPGNRKITTNSVDVSHQKSRIAIFASGAGSNAGKIIDYFRYSNEAEIALIVCNKQKAGVLSIAEKETIPVLFIHKNTMAETGYVDQLKKEKIDFIVLAGFLWQIPASLIKAFPNRIINIHPGLLPAYGGKGMYGDAVHEAVLKANERESGITIHFVDEHYDHGEIIFQAKTMIEPQETIDSLKNKVHALEHEHFSTEIEKIIKKKGGFYDLN
ncbi:MAG: phosphoribosylglycinamide formyltransferase [Ginsengibacter sp.]